MYVCKCAEHRLLITNTTFRMKDKHKTSWMHPRSKHWHLIDYVITRQRDRADVLPTRAMAGSTACSTDHRLIRAKVAIRIAPKHRKQQTSRRRFDIGKLKDLDTSNQFKGDLQERLLSKPDDNLSVEEHWTHVKTALTDACKEAVGFKTKRHQDWFNENDKEIRRLIESKRQAFTDWQNHRHCNVRKAKYHILRADVQREIRNMKDKWWIDKAAEIQGYADNHKSREFYAATRTIYGPTQRHTAPLRSKDGTTLIKDKEGILSRWKEHFTDLLNRDSHVQPDSLDNVPAVPVREELDDMIHIEEVRKAVKQMKCNKASGGDGIPAEVYKHGGTALVRHLHRLFLKIWKHEEVPQELKDASIVTIFKKGSRTECGNYRGISLLSVAGKILAKVLLNRLQPLSESIIPETQCGFRPGRGTTDMIFSARQVQEKCREQGRDLCLAFIDFTKAFDSVNREALWACLARLGCPPKFVNITRQLHEGMKGCVLFDGEQSGSFNINTGVKQGCVIAPTLFSIFLAAFISLAAVDQAKGVGIIYHTDGELFNMRRLKAKTKVKATSIVDLQYADDCAIAAHTEADLQNTLDAFSEAYKLLGLTVNVTKTKVLFQPAQPLTATAPNIDIEGATLENVDHFAYLGS